MGLALNGRAFLSGVEEKQVASLAGETNLVGRRVPAEGGGDLLDAFVGDGVGLLLNIPNSHSVVVGVRSDRVLGNSVPLEAQNLLGVTLQNAVGFGAVLSHCFVFEEPQLDGGVFGARSQEVVVVVGELNIEDISVMSSDERDVSIESLEVVGGEHSQGAGFVPGEGNKFAIGSNTVGVVGHSGLHSLELLEATESSFSL